MNVRRFIASIGLVIATFSCRGYDTIPLQEAEWRRVQPELAGMSAAQLWRCAGPPLREATAPRGAVTMVYRYADLKNYCEVTLLLQDGKYAVFRRISLRRSSYGCSTAPIIAADLRGL